MLSTPKAKGELFLASSLCDGLEDNDIRQVTTLLLNKDADPNVLIPSHGVAPFHLVIGNDSEAFAEEVTKLFLRHGGDPNVRSIDGLTPVHVAAAWGRVNVLQLLLEAGGDPLRLDDEGRSPFHYAFDGKFYNAVSILGKYYGKKDKSRDRVADTSIYDSGKDDSLINDFDGEGSIPLLEFSNAFVVKSSPKAEERLKFQQQRQSLEDKIDIAHIKKLNEQGEPEAQDERWLINRIIDQLSTSLTSNKNNGSHGPGQIFTSPTTTEEPSASSEEENFLVRTKTKRNFGTPKYKRKVFTQRTRSPCTGPKSTSRKNKKALDRVPKLYNPEDSIISKSPNFLLPTSNISDRIPKTSQYFTPRLKCEDLHVGERILTREGIRSTPRRRKFYRATSKKYTRKGDDEPSNSFSSPDTSLPLDNMYKCIDVQSTNQLRVNLHESKYDQDVEGPADFIINTTNKLIEDNKTSQLSTESLISVQEEYKFEDPAEKVTLLERRLYVLPTCDSMEKIACESAISINSESLSNIASLREIPDKTLRERLLTLGQKPGPITNTTRCVYQKRLIKLESKGSLQPSQETLSPKRQTDGFLDYGKWTENINVYRTLEQNIFKEFVSPTPSKQWREGNKKTSFNYLLLDSRITKDLPLRAMSLSNEQIWRTFVSAIFYVGKGKCARPHAHLYDAFKAWVSGGQNSTVSKKIQKILEIWNAGYGVVCLYVFLNTMPVEAFTREAAMIEALGTKNVANVKSGEYYGQVAKWSSKEKRQFGRYLLYRAMQVLLQDGERQLFPENL